MAVFASRRHELAGGVGRFFSHVAAFVAGLILMIVGVGLGVTIVLLPLGVPVGFVGLLLFLYGLFGFQGPEEAPAVPTPTESGRGTPV